MKSIYIIVPLILGIILIGIIKSSNKNFEIDINPLVMLLGGSDNIIRTEYNMSRFIVTLKDVSLADKNKIEKMGAQGVVEMDNKLKIILGEGSGTIRKYISEIK